MPVVRLDTYKASAWLVWQLKHSGATVHEDGGDIIHVGLPSGEAISIHLIESSIPPYEIKSTLAYNDANNQHTLFLMWADMLMPPEGHVVEVQPWEWTMLALYGDRIWSYDVFGGEVFIFPVHYDRHGQYREIRYGDTVSVKHLVGSMVETHFPDMMGKWRVAGFAERSHHQHYQTAGNGHRSASIPQPGSLAAAFILLGLDAEGLEAEDVKTAFRRIARKIHPDVNRAADATKQMQALNEAYQKIMATFEDKD